MADDKTIQIVIKAKDETDAAIEDVKDGLGEISKEASGLGDAFSVAIGQVAAQSFMQVSDAVGRFGASVVQEAGAAQLAMAQLDAVLESTSEAGAGAAEQISEEAVAALSDAQGEMTTLNEQFANAQVDLQEEMSDAMVDIADDAARRLEDIQRNHVDKMGDIRQSLQYLEEDFAFANEDRQIKLNQRLEDLQESFADKRESLMERIAQTDDKDKKASLRRQLADAEEDFKREEARAKERADREMKRAKELFDRKQKALQEQIQRENEEYRRQTQLINEQQSEREAAVVERFQREAEAAAEAYQKELQTIKDTIAEVNAEIQATAAPPSFDVARPTKEMVLGLAEDLSTLTMFEDDAIVAAESLMLSFKNVGEEVFPDATEAVLDMSQAMGQDLKSSVILIGKALNDPIIGMSAMQRVGVTLTESQKDLVTAMVESGDIMGAQKIILQELQSEFGGSAVAAGQTFPGAMQRLNNSWGNFKEAVGTAFIENEAVMESIERLIILLGDAAEFFSNLPAPVQGTIIALGGIIVVIGKLAPMMLGMSALINAITGAGGFAGLGTTIAGVGTTISTFVSATLVPLISSLGSVAAAFLIPLLPIIALGAAIAGLVYVIINFGDEAMNTLSMIGQLFVAMVDRAIYELGELWEKIKTTATNLKDQAFTWFETIGDSIVQGIINGIKNAWTNLVDTMKDLANSALEAAKEALEMGSPSMAFAREVGAPSAQGFAMGFQQALPGATRTAYGGITSSFTSSPVASANAGIAASGSGGSAQNITIMLGNEVLKRYTVNAVNEEVNVG